MRVIILMIVSFTIACKAPDSNPHVEKLYKEVMRVHDEVMPETSTIHKLKKEIQNNLGNDSTATVLVEKLDQADEAMMSWMAEFSNYKKVKNEEEQIKLDYLNNELTKITDVKNQMLEVIQDAKKYIKENETK